MDDKNRNTQQNMNQTSNSKENMEKLQKKIKEKWSGLSDSDVKLYDGKREEFFAKLKEKSSISKEEAQKEIKQIEKDCGCVGTSKAA